MIDAFEKACGKKIPFQVTGRRPGDVMVCYADTSQAITKMGWKANYDIDDMCKDVWLWQTKNPNGYD